MRKTERQAAALALGTFVLLVGITQVCIATNAQLTLQNIATRVAQLICGGFLIVVGAYIFAWGVSDEAGETASDFLRSIWDRFLKAFGR